MRISPREFVLALGLLCGCTTSFAQSDQCLPEIDLYSKVYKGMRLQFQASQTREANEPIQASFGPTIEFSIGPLALLTEIARHDLDPTKSHVGVFSIGYRRLPQANGGAATNRLQPIATFRMPSTRKLSLSDRSEFDLDWKSHGFTWRYRNRVRAEGPIHLGGYHPTLYASVEAYYENQYGKIADTAIEAGCLFPIKKHVQLDNYYEHQNETGKSPNQQLDQLGVTLNIFF